MKSLLLFLLQMNSHSPISLSLSSFQASVSAPGSGEGCQLPAVRDKWGERLQTDIRSPGPIIKSCSSKGEVCPYSSCFPSSSLWSLTPCSLSWPWDFHVCWSLSMDGIPGMALPTLSCVDTSLVVHCPWCHLSYNSSLGFPSQIL